MVRGTPGAKGTAAEEQDVSRFPVSGPSDKIPGTVTLALPSWSAIWFSAAPAATRNAPRGPVFLLPHSVGAAIAARQWRCAFPHRISAKRQCLPCGRLIAAPTDGSFAGAYNPGLIRTPSDLRFARPAPPKVGAKKGCYGMLYILQQKRYRAGQGKSD